MMAVVLAEPMSSPATRRSGFIAVWRSLGRGNEDRARRRAAGAARDPLRRVRCSARRSQRDVLHRPNWASRRAGTAARRGPSRRDRSSRARRSAGMSLRIAPSRRSTAVSRVASAPGRPPSRCAGSIGSATPRSSYTRKPARAGTSATGTRSVTSTTSVPGSLRRTITLAELRVTAHARGERRQSDPTPTPVCRPEAARECHSAPHSACRRISTRRTRKNAIRRSTQRQPRAATSRRGAPTMPSSASRTRGIRADSIADSARRATAVRFAVVAHASRPKRASSSGPVA